MGYYVPHFSIWYNSATATLCLKASKDIKCTYLQFYKKKIYVTCKIVQYLFYTLYTFHHFQEPFTYLRQELNEISTCQRFS